LLPEAAQTGLRDLLAVVALVGGLLAGYHMAGGKARSWLHTVGFGLVLASTVSDAA
jgi:hypothetical protein